MDKWLKRINKWKNKKYVASHLKQGGKKKSYDGQTES